MTPNSEQQFYCFLFESSTYIHYYFKISDCIIFLESYHKTVQFSFGTRQHGIKGKGHVKPNYTFTYVAMIRS